MDCLHWIIGKYLAKFFALGISPDNLGSHSARKYASNHASSGTTVSLPMVSMCLCAMWSLGHVKERYMQFEKAGNQYLGRVVSGLVVNNMKFAVSPPFFDFDVTRPADGTDESVYSLLRDYTVRGKSVSASVHCIFYFCFASLCFHFDNCCKLCTQRINCRHCISSTKFQSMQKMQLLSNILGIKLKQLPHSPASLLT